MSKKAEKAAAAAMVTTTPNNNHAPLVVDLSMKSIASAVSPVSPLTTAALLSIERIKQATTLLGGAHFFPRLILEFRTEINSKIVLVQSFSVIVTLCLVSLCLVSFLVPGLGPEKLVTVNECHNN